MGRLNGVDFKWRFFSSYLSACYDVTFLVKIWHFEQISSTNDRVLIKASKCLGRNTGYLDASPCYAKSDWFIFF